MYKKDVQIANAERATLHNFSASNNQILFKLIAFMHYLCEYRRNKADIWFSPKINRYYRMYNRVIAYFSTKSTEPYNLECVTFVMILKETSGSVYLISP